MKKLISFLLIGFLIAHPVFADSFSNSKMTVDDIEDGTGDSIMNTANNAINVFIAGGSSSGTQYEEGDTAASATGTLAMGKNGTTLKAIQTDSSGNVVVTDGSGAMNVIVDSGSITANAGTNLNTSALALESGGNLAAAATSLGTLDNAISGSEMQVDVVGSLPAGTNAIGKLSSNNGVDIGDVDVTSISAGNNNIGDVDVASIAAGNNNIGDVDVASMPNVTVGTFPDNEPFNLAQVNGTTTPVATAATDTTGAGVQQDAPLFQADDASTTACTENRFCHPRINATRRSIIIEGVASGTAVPVSAASGTIASGAIASGAVASGAYASGAFASGAAASGSWASGALVDITNVSMPITPATATATKTIGLGAEYRSTLPTWTNTQQGAMQVGTRGSLHVELWNTDSNVAVPSGSGTATGAMRVEIANNGTGLVTTNPATAANWGVYVEDATETAGANLQMAGSVRRDTAATSAGSTAENATINTSAEGAVWSVLTPTTTSGLSVANFTSGDSFTALTNSAQVIKASAGNLYGYYIYNPNSSATYVLVYNTAAASVTVGTTNPFLVFAIPATSGANVMFPYPITFSNAGWSAAAATTGGGNSAPSTALEVMFWYK